MQVIDLEAVVRLARKRGLIAIVDNTFASPFNFRPAEWGFDLSVHSGTKYLNGHSDIVAGAVIGKHELVTKVLHKLNHLGATLDAHACFLLHRGMKTLALRVKHQNQSALQLAVFLAQHQAISRVNYPGLPDSPYHARAKRFLEGYSGMLSFELKGGVDAAEDLIAPAAHPLLRPQPGRPGKPDHPARHHLPCRTHPGRAGGDRHKRRVDPP